MKRCAYVVMSGRFVLLRNRVWSELWQCCQPPRDPGWRVWVFDRPARARRAVRHWPQRRRFQIVRV